MAEHPNHFIENILQASTENEFIFLLGSQSDFVDETHHTKKKLMVHACTMNWIEAAKYINDHDEYRPQYNPPLWAVCAEHARSSEILAAVLPADFHSSYQCSKATQRLLDVPLTPVLCDLFKSVQNPSDVSRFSIQAVKTKKFETLLLFEPRMSDEDQDKVFWHSVCGACMPSIDRFYTTERAQRMVDYYSFEVFGDQKVGIDYLRQRLAKDQAAMLEEQVKDIPVLISKPHKM